MNIREDIKIRIFEHLIDSIKSKQRYSHCNSNINTTLLNQFFLAVVFIFLKKTKRKIYSPFEG